MCVCAVQISEKKKNVHVLYVLRMWNIQPILTILFSSLCLHNQILDLQLHVCIMENISVPSGIQHHCGQTFFYIRLLEYKYFLANKNE